jgi:hypothetical protein
VRALAGSNALVLVAPHGARRDYDRRPWGSAPLKVNDLHTASLTEELAAATGAAALINDELDRNDTDLNRLGAAHERAPEFLHRLGDLLSAALARHGRATVLTVHGWNVIQPAVDLGFGCAAGAPVGPAAAVSPGFAATALPALVRACGARGIAATVGARYPARGRENLIQLFTPRYRDDRRALVSHLAALGERTNAMQLELGVPLRWPGTWRRRLIEACVAALPALLAEEAATTACPMPIVSHAPKVHRHTLEIAADDASGLVTLDATGARLLLFPPDGGLALFTGERTGGEEPGRVGGLRIDASVPGTLHVRFTGPMVRFADTTPFLDLERGLSRAAIVEHADVALDFVASHPNGSGAADFGTVRGKVTLDGRTLPLDGRGFASGGAGAAPWPRVRAALDLGGGDGLSVMVDLRTSGASGFLCRGGEHLPIVSAKARLGRSDDPLSTLVLDVELAGGEHLELRPEPVHRLPVVRGGAPVPVRLLYAACRLPGLSGPAGWCEIGGL